ncbi:DUF397 domain-containing protein [Nocardiopsis sp. NPDC006832]|uniref:DUF397 domain-containing protein n=1 Tax=Nocardiopsis sp. NPDC006832 TaxID=3157188 RepID=UPI0033DB6D62
MIIPLNFRESGYSATGHGCVEVAGSHTGTAVRDSEHSVEGQPASPSTEWASFIRATTGS